MLLLLLIITTWLTRLTGLTGLARVILVIATRNNICSLSKIIRIVREQVTLLAVDQAFENRSCSFALAQ